MLKHPGSLALCALSMMAVLAGGAVIEARAADAMQATPQVIATGLDAPWSIAFFGNTPLVSERNSARVLALDGNGKGRQVAKIAGVNGRGEGGLLGIAVHGAYLYAYFTAGAENRIERYRIEGKDADLKLGAGEKIFGGIPSASYHNGGRLAFGPDGMLYATTGDAGEKSRAQDLKSLGGKILRMTPEGRVPRDNPFPGSYVYSYGHRNVQGLAWAGDGTMYASEFGENTWDELNLIRPGGNYGWPEVEGKGGHPGFIDPIQQWPTAEASPSGMAILGGHIYIASLRGQRLRKIPLSAPGTAAELYVRQYGRLRDAVVTPDDKLWILTNNTDGRGQARAGDDRILSVPGL
ncbi:MAG: Quinoprotein glucose dehydrogenase B [Herbaspirillum frisingense]|uniref:Quinoprotein glucose dehydrogenase B n=1 Tax=Herbaspirillum frisingense TaxID=92645 RepID=A0A7V8JT99_9BURK|nr:MAG: Quinoprotein glucose dehydrogenase B [Herbaspirillum frisingense]